MTGSNADSANIEKAREAIGKLQELLHCGNERVEFSAAKEILAFLDRQEPAAQEEAALDVTIRVVE